MRVTILYFAVARERARRDEEVVELPEGSSVADLTALVAKLHPGLAPLLGRIRFAVNETLAEGRAPLADGDEVALIPPVAGGSGKALVSDHALDAQAALQAVRGPDAGGIVVFTGTARDTSHGRKVVRLEYEAYAAMATAVLERVARECEEAFPGARVAIHHRVGRLAIGESAVVVVAAAPHRREAFGACERAVDRLKEEAPIWKKEVFEDGEEWVGLGP